MTGWRLESIGRDDLVPTESEAPADEPEAPGELTAGDFSVAPAPRAEKPRGSRVTPILILLLVIVLFAASAWYVYQRFAAPGASDVPVIRADTAPVTQEPDDPGGLTIPNQDSVLLERGEVDEAVIDGEPSAGAGTVPITDLPLNIDSSSDVAGLAADDVAEAVDDAAGALEAATDDAAAAVDAVADDAAAAVAEVADDAESTASSALGAAADEAEAVAQEATDLAAQIAEQGGPTEGVSAGSVDVAELTPPSLDAADATADAATDDGPTVLIGRSADAVEGAADSAAEAVSESVAEAGSGAGEGTQQTVEDVLSLPSSGDTAAQGGADDPLAQPELSIESADNPVADNPVADLSTGGARIVQVPQESDASAADAAAAAGSELAEAANENADAAAVAEAETDTQVAEILAQSEEAPAETAEAGAAEASDEAQTAAVPADQPAPEPLISPTASGGYRVQMSSVQSRESAQESWASLRNAHPDLLSALTLTIQQAEVRGSTYYRVQVGPLDESGAVGLCEQLKTRGQDCLLVRP